MANYYTLGSGVLHFSNAEDRWWLEGYLEAAMKYAETADDYGVYPDDVEPPNSLAEFMKENELFCIPFLSEIDDNGICFYHDESIDSGAVVAIVSDYMREFQRPEFWSMEFAFTCSRPRPGEFGGMSILVTRDHGVHYHSTYDWIDGKIKELQGGEE